MASSPVDTHSEASTDSNLDWFKFKDIENQDNHIVLDICGIRCFIDTTKILLFYSNCVHHIDKSNGQLIAMSIKIHTVFTVKIWTPQQITVIAPNIEKSFLLSVLVSNLMFEIGIGKQCRH